MDSSVECGAASVGRFQPPSPHRSSRCPYSQGWRPAETHLRTPRFGAGWGQTPEGVEQNTVTWCKKQHNTPSFTFCLPRITGNQIPGVTVNGCKWGLKIWLISVQEFYGCFNAPESLTWMQGLELPSTTSRWSVHTDQLDVGKGCECPSPRKPSWLRTWNAAQCSKHNQDHQNLPTSAGQSIQKAARRWAFKPARDDVGLLSNQMSILGVGNKDMMQLEERHPLFILQPSMGLDAFLHHMPHILVAGRWTILAPIPIVGLLLIHPLGILSAPAHKEQREFARWRLGSCDPSNLQRSGQGRCRALPRHEGVFRFGPDLGPGLLAVWVHFLPIKVVFQGAQQPGMGTSKEESTWPAVLGGATIHQGRPRVTGIRFEEEQHLLAFLHHCRAAGRIWPFRTIHTVRHGRVFGQTGTQIYSNRRMNRQLCIESKISKHHTGLQCGEIADWLWSAHIDHLSA